MKDLLKIEALQPRAVTAAGAFNFTRSFFRVHGLQLFEWLMSSPWHSSLNGQHAIHWQRSAIRRWRHRLLLMTAYWRFRWLYQTTDVGTYKGKHFIFRWKTMQEGKGGVGGRGWQVPWGHLISSLSSTGVNSNVLPWCVYKNWII